MELFVNFVDKTLMETLNHILSSEFVRLPCAEVVEILKTSQISFEYPVLYVTDPQYEHKKYLTETHYKKPVILHDYRKTIKPFCMRWMKLRLVKENY